MQKYTRGLSAISLAGVGLIAAGSALYSTQIEPARVGVESLTLRPRHLPPAFDGFSLVQISDFHFGAWMKRDRLTRVVDQVNTLDADAVVITGDFVDDERITPRLYDELCAELSRLTAPTFGVLGNHDHWAGADTVAACVEAAGVTLLSNRHYIFERNGERLYLAGVDDVYEKCHDLDRALDGVPYDAFVLLLAHESDFADTVAADGRVAVQLSGHSHGGQVRLPLIGSIITPPMGRKYDMGLYTVEDLLLYVNRGVGMSPWALRFNCPPEITHITLRH